MGNKQSIELEHPMYAEEPQIHMAAMESGLRRTKTIEKIGNGVFSAWKLCLSGCSTLHELAEERFDKEVHERKQYYVNASNTIGRPF